ncbi:HlyD family secretion protein [Legionella nagasakiensis]|uniref:HlyD family secretion protein n=1 Tax=Legionella nagasakiensis TaxID=535290 RepID=UPI001055AF07|nr:efflux RND transporter periplasmic adaptor subunit [Legionella nagasakiensis]
MDRSKLVSFRYWPHVISLTVITIAYLAYRYFAYYNTHTDDAYVSAHVVNMAALVSGPISKIYIKDNQQVKKGDKLLEIDPRPYLYAMQKTKADLNMAKIKYKNDKFAINVAEERFKQSQVMLRLSEDHVKRYQKLQSKGDLAEIKLLDMQAKMQEQAAVVMAAAQELKIAQENLDINEVLAAKAAYSKAHYLYHHTTLYAPENGYITNFNIRHGQYIKKGQGLFALVETKYWWVVSRYRETAIRLIKIGDKAKITLDMYPGKTFHGHVESIGWGINRVQAGEVAPSTLTYMEATEDWIKIAQRFPVRIFFDEIDEKYPLRIGANATTTTYR